MKREHLLHWLPALLWTILLIIASSGWFSSGNTGGLLEKLLSALHLPLGSEEIELIHHWLRKLGHLSAYAILALLWDRALNPLWPRWGYTAVWLICLIIASWDEWHQSLLPDRLGSPGDVAIDMLGATLVILILMLLRYRKRNRRKHVLW